LRKTVLPTATRSFAKLLLKKRLYCFKKMWMKKVTAHLEDHFIRLYYMYKKHSKKLKI
jgi:hypothetical protein